MGSTTCSMDGLKSFFLEEAIQGKLLDEECYKLECRILFKCYLAIVVFMCMAQFDVTLVSQQSCALQVCFILVILSHLRSRC